MGEHYLVEAALENAEAVFDAAMKDDVLVNIPVVGIAIKICKAMDDLRSRAFAMKIDGGFAGPALKLTIKGFRRL